MLEIPTGSPAGAALRAARPAIEERLKLAAPALLAWEVVHVVQRKSPERYGSDFDIRWEVITRLLDGVELVPPDDAALRRTASLADRYRLSGYDAAYLELASRDGGSVLVTEDDDLLRAARKALGTRRATDASGAASLA